MSALLSFLVLAQEAQEESADLAEEGRRIIIAMLLTGLTFLAVIALGQLSRYLTHRRRERREAERRLY
jgi:hypothetical protein